MRDQIDKAIAAHGSWKIKLRTAIDTGKFDGSPDKVRMDNACAFGVWLYGAEIPSEVKKSEIYAKVKSLHAEFHKIAAAIAEAAVSGQKAKAEEMMKMGGSYSLTSSNLIQALMAWRDGKA